jgi:hypothetical protein
VRHDRFDAFEQRPGPGLRPRRDAGRRARIPDFIRRSNRECIVCGEGVAIPIHVRFDDLEPEKRPAPDPSFANSWRETGDEEGLIRRTSGPSGHGSNARNGNRRQQACIP